MYAERKHERKSCERLVTCNHACRAQSRKHRGLCVHVDTCYQHMLLTFFHEFNRVEISARISDLLSASTSLRSNWTTFLSFVFRRFECACQLLREGNRIQRKMRRPTGTRSFVFKSKELGNLDLPLTVIQHRCSQAPAVMLHRMLVSQQGAHCPAILSPVSI